MGSHISTIFSTLSQIVGLFSSQLLSVRRSLFAFQVPVSSFSLSFFRLRFDFRMLSTVLIPLSKNPLSLLCESGLPSSEETSIFSFSGLLIGEAGSEVTLLVSNSIFLFILSLSRRFTKQVDGNH